MADVCVFGWGDAQTSSVRVHAFVECFASACPHVDCLQFANAQSAMFLGRCIDVLRPVQQAGQSV
eukprot:8387534-Lingulodinium_polyedra.AAC.1